MIQARVVNPENGAFAEIAEHPTDPDLVILRTGFHNWIESELTLNRIDVLNTCTEELP
jgi:hypothetical protein